MQSSLIPFLVAALAAAAVWVGYAIAEARARRRLAALERAFRGYATEHGLTVVPFVDVAGASPGAGPPLVRGELQGVALELTVHPSARSLTCVEAPLPGVSNGFVLQIRKRTRRLPRAFEGHPITEAPTGNKAFDAAFALLSNEPDLARSLVDRRLAQVVLGFPRVFVDLYACDNRLLLAWRGMETDRMVLEAAVEVVFTACRRRA